MLRCVVTQKKTWIRLASNRSQNLWILKVARESDLSFLFLRHQRDDRRLAKVATLTLTERERSIYSYAQRDIFSNWFKSNISYTRLSNYNVHCWFLFWITWRSFNAHLTLIWWLFDVHLIKPHFRLIYCLLHTHLTRTWRSFQANLVCVCLSFSAHLSLI